MASFLCTSSRHLDCYTHNIVLQLFVYMALLTMSSLSPVTGSSSSFYSQYPVALVDVHRYLEIEVISEAYVF